MSSPGDPLDELSIPDETTVEEHDIVTDSDVLVGSNSRIEFGVRSRTIAAGERVDFGRHLEVDNDCRLDMLCAVDGSVLVGADAYIGARVHIGGQLLVSGDLDIGDDVEIDEGFETNGWIHTRNPVPALVFYFIVLSQFLRFGDEKGAEEFASALTDADAEHRPPLVIPRGAELSDDAWRVSTPATIGDDCRLHGNIRAESIVVGADTTIFGSLRAREDIEVGSGTVVIGDVTTRNGTVTLQAGCEVRGDVACQELVVHEGADVDGALRAKGDMKLVRRADTASEPAYDEEPAASPSDETSTEQSAGDETSTESAEQSATDST
ncbi:polymer-forming cytoskeletal protein [Halohasta salina]|uniref:polymer-forming cytoskeletal protein n=1 Tax=Halohasta salina TaxID=2961621 RepID=UPI002AA2B11C|nr:polymer-forming cytoskeletal protein [Halohasta salina]